MQVFFFPFILMTLVQANSAPRGSADLVFINGKIWTVDERQPVAEGVAIADGKIVEVGLNAKIQAFVGSKTRVVDLKGRLMLPGFIDNQTHFVDGGFQLSGIDLRQAKDE